MYIFLDAKGDNNTVITRKMSTKLIITDINKLGNSNGKPLLPGVRSSAVVPESKTVVIKDTMNKRKSPSLNKVRANKISLHKQASNLPDITKDLQVKIIEIFFFYFYFII